MRDTVFVTGNVHKAEYFAKMMQMDIERLSIDVDEIQSLDIRDVVEHKARQAYAKAQKPVIVEDTKLVFKALGSLPGTFIKWFQEELGDAGLCKLLDGYSDRTAVAGAAIAYYDGKNLKIFERELTGSISKEIRGDSGFGWNRIFIPSGQDKTLAEMSEARFKEYYSQVKPFDQLKVFLEAL